MQLLGCSAIGLMMVPQYALPDELRMRWLGPSHCVDGGVDRISDTLRRAWIRLRYRPDADILPTNEEQLLLVVALCQETCAVSGNRRICVAVALRRDGDATYKERTCHGCDADDSLHALKARKCF